MALITEESFPSVLGEFLCWLSPSTVMWPVSDRLVSVPVLALVTTAEMVLGHWTPRAEGLNICFRCP